METSLYGRRGGASVLFAEDFDLALRQAEPEPPPEPEVIEPLFTAAELAAAQDEARREAAAQVRVELAAAGETAARGALAAIAEHLALAASEARAVAETSAEAIAQLLLAAFGAAFPALCARHGDAEVQAVLRRLLPSLYSEPRVTIRVAAAAEPGVTQVLAGLDPDLLAPLQVIAAADMSIGDVRVAWHAGHALRDTAQLWRDIEAILAPAGLLPPDPPSPPTRQETANVD